ncbi:MAG: hypothetical protein D6815_11180, partial [Candidatus Dadabacteria bacterium]
MRGGRLASVERAMPVRPPGRGERAEAETMKRTMPKPLGLCALAAAAVLVAASQAAAAACGQPVTTGNKPTATDALFVLKAAVGSGSC